MARSRKTFEVGRFRASVNHLLAYRGDTASLVDGLTPEQAYRLGAASALETVLLSTNSYKGYNLLGSEYLPAEEQSDGNVIKPDADDSRRYYYGSG